jgi:hypothetical protein
MAVKFKVFDTCWGAVAADNAHDRANGFAHCDVADLKALLRLAAHHGRLQISKPSSAGGRYYLAAGRGAAPPPDVADGPVTLEAEGCGLPGSRWERVKLVGPGERGERRCVEVWDLEHFAAIVNTCGDVLVIYQPHARRPFLLKPVR